jgi:hypothetical protein
MILSLFSLKETEGTLTDQFQILWEKDFSFLLKDTDEPYHLTFGGNFQFVEFFLSSVIFLAVS